MNARTLLAAVRRQPLLVVGGLVALLILANLRDLFGGGAEAEPAPEPGADPEAAPVDPYAADTIGADQAPFLMPNYGASYPAYDPFTTDPGGTTQPTIEYTPEGCPLPRPPAPTGMSGMGEYKCDGPSKTWVWAWNPAKVTAKGCLLPKPDVDPRYTGRGDWECNGTTKQWVWKWKVATPPPPADKPGRLVLAAGGSAPTFNVKDRVAGGRQVWSHGAATVQTGGRVDGIKMPSGERAALVRMTSGPRKGRWIRPSEGTWTAPVKGS